MTTIKPRINITADTGMERALIQAAKRDRVPVATKAAELLRLALDLEEDFLLAKITDERTAQKGRFLTHERVWL